MAFADDLLHQARHLATLDLRKPKQANLRRAISSAYYALFHLLVAASANKMSPKGPSDLSRRIARAFVHSEMKQVCRSISAGQLSPALKQLRPGGFSDELKTIAQSFSDLQDARHGADYDLSETFSRVECLDLVDTAESAFRLWTAIRNRDEANVFVAALLFGARWSK